MSQILVEVSKLLVVIKDFSQNLTDFGPILKDFDQNVDDYGRHIYFGLHLKDFGRNINYFG